MNVVKKIAKKMTKGKSVQNKVKGHFDGFNGEEIWGWASGIDGKTIPKLALFVNDEFYLEIHANRFRQDLLDAGIGNGKCAFSEKLNVKEIIDRYGVNFSLAVKDLETSCSLIGSPIKMQKPDLVWSIDVDDDSTFAGWVADRNSQSLVVPINVYVNNERVGTRNADLVREDLAVTGSAA